jgi:hypothetical protein
MKLARWMSGAAGVAVLMVASYAVGAKATRIVLPARQLSWAPEAPGLPQQMVTLWGDRKKGEAAVLIKAPAGWRAGRHAHTADYHAVLIAGTWIHSIGGAGPDKELLPGSHWMQPANQMHDDRCKEGAECIVLVHSDEKIETVPGTTK